MLAGCALSLAGLMLQTVLNNALAGPSIIGVTSGAGLFTALVTALFPPSIILIFLWISLDITVFQTI